MSQNVQNVQNVQTLQIVQSEQTVQTVQSYTIVFSFRSVCTVGTLALQL